MVVRLGTRLRSARTSEADAGPSRFKVLLLGGAGVGKTALMMRWTEDTFDEWAPCSTGVDFRTRPHGVKVRAREREVQVQVWDLASTASTAACPLGDPLGCYCRGSHVVVLVVDMSTAAAGVEDWLASIKRRAQPGVQLGLLWNKIDEVPSTSSASADPPTTAAPEPNDEPVSTPSTPASNFEALMRSLAAAHDVPLFKASAKTGQGVHAAFAEVVQRAAQFRDPVPDLRLRAPSVARLRSPTDCDTEPAANEVSAAAEPALGGLKELGDGPPAVACKGCSCCTS